MKVTKLRIITVFTVTLLVFLVIGFRLFQIQVVNHNFFLKKVSIQARRTEKHISLRGDIYDRRMRLLATSMMVDSCYIDMEEARGRIDINLFAECTGLSPVEISSKLNQKRRYVLIKRKLLPEESLKIKSKNFPGVYFDKEQLRFYPENSLANYVVGVVGVDNKGLSGVEYLFDNFLAGEAVKYVLTRDGQGRIINFSEKAEDEIRRVVLTIDNRIQHAVEQELKRAHEYNSASMLTCIVQNPKTGEILAMASYPSDNPNKKITTKMLKNSAISDAIEPGSVFKIVSAAAAIEKYPDILNEKFFCENGEYELVKDVTIHDHEKYGELSFEEMFAYSSNIGFAKLSRRIGERSLWQYIRSFGFGMTTGIELTGENQGRLLPTGRWSGVSCEMLSFGQEISATPLQIANSFSVIANGGVLMESKIIKSVFCGDKEEQIFKPTKVRRVISQKTASHVKDMLEAVVEYGTGSKAKIKGINIAGKTGTAQKYDKKLKKYSETKYVSLFGGFLPADDPKITILVVIDEPQGGYWASSVAAPVFRKIALRILDYMNIHPVKEIAMK
ncbi:MAG: penicillin-binding protein 2 [Elusimicrobia bacterium]|nr:penicillin-binding protein 2 [Elusimicrobiota bacterium]